MREGERGEREKEDGESERERERVRERDGIRGEEEMQMCVACCHGECKHYQKQGPGQTNDITDQLL